MPGAGSSPKCIANHWKHRAFSEVFATQLWGEPIVIFRDTDGELVCAKDSSLALESIHPFRIHKKFEDSSQGGGSK